MAVERRGAGPAGSGAALAMALAVALGAIGCSSMFDGFTGRKEACAILAVGRPASATVVRLVDTGTTLNDDPVVEFVLRVMPPGGEPYEARTKALISRLEVPAVQPGRVFPVKFDPQDPRRVAIDLWECPKK